MGKPLSNVVYIVRMMGNRDEGVADMIVGTAGPSVGNGSARCCIVQVVHDRAAGRPVDAAGPDGLTIAVACVVQGHIGTKHKTPRSLVALARLAGLAHRVTVLGRHRAFFYSPVRTNS